MTSHRQLRSTVDGLAAVAIGAALMAAAPIGAAVGARPLAGVPNWRARLRAVGGRLRQCRAQRLNPHSPDDPAACRITCRSLQRGSYGRG